MFSLGTKAIQKAWVYKKIDKLKLKQFDKFQTSPKVYHGEQLNWIFTSRYSDLGEQLANVDRGKDMQQKDKVISLRYKNFELARRTSKYILFST